MKKSLLSIVVSFLIFGGIIFPSVSVSANQEVTTSASGFTDVSSGYTFYDEVLYLSSEDVISGFTDGTFRPNETVTRAQAAIMIGRARGLSGEPRNTNFTDVNSNVTGSGYIASAVEKGIISGFPDGSYRPYQPVTRGQMAIFLNRAYTLTSGQTNSFNDVSSNMAAYQSILNVAANGIASGYPDGTYRPDQPVTRGQFSAFMARTLEPSFRVPSEDTSLVPVFGDIALGMTKEQVKNLETATLFSEEPNTLTYTDEWVFGFSAMVVYEFENNKLAAINVYHDGVNELDLDLLETYFVMMYDNLSIIYGMPVFLDTDWFDDSNGYTLSAYWVTDDHSMLLITQIDVDYYASGGFRISIK
jgi:hypothetical protein